MPDLLVAPCDRNAAEYAVMHWHYSRRMSAGKLVTFGVWENERFIGAVIFGRGGNSDLGSPYGCDQTEACELVRVALDQHQSTVSRIVALSLTELRRTNPGLRLVVSFADTARGHHGGIYQAGNWVYAGGVAADVMRIHGKIVHARTVFSRYGTKRIDWLRANIDPLSEWVSVMPKHRYLYPLDRAMRRQITKLAQPYPRGLSVHGDTSAFHVGETGSSPVDRSQVSV